MPIHHLRIERHARYYTDRDPGPDVKRIWMLFHGYGELARDFLDRCALLAGPGVLLVAPEGLSRFYHRSGRGSIGASWMTSEDREREIEDYIAYIDRVWSRVSALSPNAVAAVLGFSQGGATAVRWSGLGIASVADLVLWGSSFPREELEQYVPRFRDTRVATVSGEGDRVVGIGEVNRLAASVEELGLQSRRFRHAGGHELDEGVLREIAALPPARNVGND